MRVIPAERGEGQTPKNSVERGGGQKPSPPMGLKEGGSEDLGHPFVICWSSTQLDSPPPQAIPSHPSINPPIHPPSYISSAHPSAYLSCLSVHPSIHLPTHPSTCPSIRLSVHYPPSRTFQNFKSCCHHKV